MVEEAAEESYPTPSYPRDGGEPAEWALPLHDLTEAGIGLGFGNRVSGERVGGLIMEVVLMACGHVNILYACAPIRVCSRPAGERGPIGVVVFTGEAGHVE